MRFICSLLCLSMFVSSVAHAQSELDALMQEAGPAIEKDIELQRGQLQQRLAEVSDLQKQIDIARQKIRVYKKVRNATFVIAISLASTVGIVLKRSAVYRLGRHRIAIRVVGAVAAATGAVATTSAGYGHYLITIEAKDLNVLEDHLNGIRNSIEVQLKSLDDHSQPATTNSIEGTGNDQNDLQ